MWARRRTRWLVARPGAYDQTPTPPGPWSLAVESLPVTSHAPGSAVAPRQTFAWSAVVPAPAVRNRTRTVSPAVRTRPLTVRLANVTSVPSTTRTRARTTAPEDRSRTFAR